MDNLQYKKWVDRTMYARKGFKPYYKWIIFNIADEGFEAIIERASFKPYYKWIIFNI